MSKMSRLLDEALLRIKLDEKKTEAEDIFNDEAKLLKFLDKVKDKLRKVPVVGTYLEEIPILVNMLLDYKNKRYTKLPTSSIVSIIAALVYFISPIDMIPDFVFSFGLLDDALVLKLALDGVRYNIHEYQEWKKMNQEESNGEVVKDAEGFSYVEDDDKEENVEKSDEDNDKSTNEIRFWEREEVVFAPEYVEGEYIDSEILDEKDGSELNQ